MKALAENCILLAEEDKYCLLFLARKAIERNSRPLDISRFNPTLQAEGASFVTLRKRGELRGCLGALWPNKALVLDVCEHAYAAAYKDSRFTPVQADEYEQLVIDVSVLSPQIQLNCENEDELLSQLRPGIDGLTIADGFKRATFLPAVWQQFNDARQFVTHLKRKAGIDENHWSTSIKSYRYETLSFSENDL